MPPLVLARWNGSTGEPVVRRKDFIVRRTMSLCSIVPPLVLARRNGSTGRLPVPPLVHGAPE